MKTRILILCTGNSCRSQMAEGVVKRYGRDRYEVESAGSEPSTVNSIAIQVMKEIDIDISGHRSKHLKEFLSQPFDYVITVCGKANDACPVFPGKAKRLHWGFPDPPHSQGANEKVLGEFRSVRDAIHAKFKTAVESGVWE